MIEIEIADQQSSMDVDGERLVRAVGAVLHDHAPPTCRISIAIVDDATIHQLNQQYLQHDYATDVLSFVLERTAEFLEGEIVVSGETAQRQASQYHWTPDDELLLYLLHGTLHLVGFDDQSASARAAMRRAEDTYLQQHGVTRGRRTTPRPKVGGT